MPWPRHVLQSVMIPAVTQTRVSGDYIPGNNQWIVGDSSILAHAVGLAPFKDVSWELQSSLVASHNCLSLSLSLSLFTELPYHQ